MTLFQQIIFNKSCIFNFSYFPLEEKREILSKAGSLQDAKNYNL